MASIVRSWMRVFCKSCEKRRIFELHENGTLVCDECGAVRHLERNGLLADAAA